jgi:hypothetical protein
MQPGQRQTAEEAYAAAVKAMQTVTHPSEVRRGFADEMLAENILHKELGYFSDPLPKYALDQQTRDRLLVHARQDAAHALIIALRLSNEVKLLAGLIWTTRAILIGLCTVLALMILWSLLAALIAK